MAAARDRGRRPVLFALCRHALLLVWAFVVLFPIYWMVLTSFKDAGDWVNWPMRWWPWVDFQPTIFNYRQIFYFGGTTATGELRRQATEQAYNIWKGIFDSAFIVTVASVLSLLLGSALAYAMLWGEVKGRLTQAPVGVGSQLRADGRAASRRLAAVALPHA